MTYQWVDCDRVTVRQRYDRLAGYIPLFDRLLFLPPDMRRNAVEHLELSRGDGVLEVGCGTGNSFASLHHAVGSSGLIFGVDISPGMLRRAKKRCDANRWRNVELFECDAADYRAQVPLDAVLFSLSYNTMSHHRSVLRNVWDQLRPGGRLVIMDAKVPPGFISKLLLPYSLWLMKWTLLGNPLFHPWEELAAIIQHVDMSEYLFGSYYICRATKPYVGATHSAQSHATHEAANTYRMAAERSFSAFSADGTHMV